MADLKQKYDTLTAFTITLASLASAALRESTSVDNEGPLYVDVLVALTLLNHASTAPTGEQACHVYAYAALDDSEAFTDGATGTDSAITLQNRAHLKYLGSAYFSAAGQTREIGPFSIAEQFGGRTPSEWGIIVENATGAALAAAGHLAKYRGVLYQSV